MRCNEAAASSTTRLIAAVRMISRRDDGGGAAARDACGIEAASSGAAARFSARCELPQPNRSRQKAPIQVLFMGCKWSRSAARPYGVFTAPLLGLGGVQDRPASGDWR